LDSPNPLQPDRADQVIAESKSGKPTTTIISPEHRDMSKSNP
jgi:hypothetical protein